MSYQSELYADKYSSDTNVENIFESCAPGESYMPADATMYLPGGQFVSASGPNALRIVVFEARNQGVSPRLRFYEFWKSRWTKEQIDEYSRQEKLAIKNIDEFNRYIKAMESVKFT